jgi:uncharacterized membrane protein YfhO
MHRTIVVFSLLFPGSGSQRSMFYLHTHFLGIEQFIIYIYYISPSFLISSTTIEVTSSSFSLNLSVELLLGLGLG